MRGIKRLAFIVLLASTIFLFLSNAKSAHAAKNVYMFPSNYVFTPENGTIGTLFNVTVWVSSDTYPWKLMMWQVYITWNNSLLDVVKIWGEVTGDWTYRAWPNDNLDGRNWDPQYVFYKKAGGTIGNPYYYENYPSLGLSSLKICDVLYNEINVTEPRILCRIEFNITKTIDSEQYLSTILNINNEDTYLYDYEGQIQDVVIEDGRYEFIPEFTNALLLIVTSAATIMAAKRRLKK